MKFQIIKTNPVNVVIGTYIVEAKNKVAAIKSLYTSEQVSEITIGLRKDGKYTVGANANQYKAVYAFNRTVMTVTEVVEATPEVVEATPEVVEVATTETVEVSIEETAAATMMTYTDAQLMDIVATHSLRNSKVDRILTEAATRELAGR